MTVVDFRTDKGLYMFQLSHLATTLHRHPAIEILWTENGRFSLVTQSSAHDHLTFAVVDANVRHQVLANDCSLRVVMVEHNALLVKNTLSQYDIHLLDGLYLQRHHPLWLDAIDGLTRQILQTDRITGYDDRVISIIEYIENHDLEYDTMIHTLTQTVNLSSSRLSHLFRENVGLSLKKYLVWCKLKKTIKQHLNNQDDLFTSLIQGGFYDQPHFSRAFKTMLGIKPSGAYNSRTLQG